MNANKTFLHQCSIIIALLISAHTSLIAAEQASTDDPVQIDEDSLEFLCKFPPVEKTPLQGKEAPPDRTQLQADEADMSTKDTTRFSGSVIIQRDNRRIEADQADYFHQSEDFKASGHIRFFTSNLLVEGEKADMNLKKETGTIEQSQYRSLNKNARGTAEKFHIAGPNLIRLENGSYTSCLPGSNDWNLSASEITLNSESRQGTASHVVLEFMGIPFLYTPYMRFPIGEQRLSGLLYPSFSSSNRHGTEISIPYYWNIAPDMDATITPHNMTRRGLMLETEFRYLNKNSQGQIQLDYMEDDKVAELDRRQLKWIHSGAADSDWSGNLSFHEVGDDAFLVDFNDALGEPNASHLSQYAALNFNNSFLSFSSLVQDHQTLSGAEPYRRLPQLSLSSRFAEPNNELNFNIASQWVRFDHPDETALLADRLHIKPTVRLPLHSNALFFVPKVSAHYTSYQYSENSESQTEQDPELSVPIYSLDTGIFLERDTSFGNTPLLQTLEPRLFYVYIPYHDQDDIPVFDSGLKTFTINSLFDENRFSGADRVGDTNQLGALITTRFLHQLTGQQMLSASIGQIQYFDDRKVTLPGGSPETSSDSSYVAQLSISPGYGVSFNTDIQWNPESERTEYSTSRLQFRLGSERLFNLGHRLRQGNLESGEGRLETREASFVWRFNDRWRFLAGNQYDIRNERNQESVVGIDYDNCCWGLRIMYREYYNIGLADYDQGLYLALELKGLSSFGQQKQSSTILQRMIPGFSN